MCNCACGQGELSIPALTTVTGENNGQEGPKSIIDAIAAFLKALLGRLGPQLHANGGRGMDIERCNFNLSNIICS